MTADDPREGDAIEYVLGTLAPEELLAFRGALEADPDLRRLVRAWEERLAPLAAAAPDVEPGPGVWSGIARALAPEGAVQDAVTPQVHDADLFALRRSRGRWRGATVALASLAAVLALALGLDRRPRPEPGLVAVVNRSGDLPALLVRVDPAARRVEVRAVAAETPADRSLELWSIAGGAPPRSLGLVAGGASRIVLPPGAAGLAEGVTLAVSLEPRGGSPTGAPTGPVVYSGKLIPEAP